MSRTFKLSLVLLSIGMFFSCKDQKTNVVNGVYVWDTRSEYSYFNEEEEQVVYQNQIKKIYCKLSDVVWDENEHAKPVDIKSFPRNSSGVGLFAKFIPCMFFTNEVMLKSDREELTYMADKIASRINKYGVSEFQVDCDWSEKSKDNYFFFLQRVKNQLDSTIALSATIRLYQYKYPEKTGVPPVDRGMLMLYNFTSPSRFAEQNSIFDKLEAEKYLGGDSYKLPLDFALPSFSWNLLYSSKNEFIGYVDEESAVKLKTKSATQDSVLFTIKKDTLINDFWYRSGQKLKVEKITEVQTKEAYDIAFKLANSDTTTISLFDLNKNTINYLKSNTHVFKK